MLKRVCSRRQIIINASPMRPSSPSTTSPRRTPLFPKKETERGCTHFSGACFLHVLLETLTLKGMCITGKFITNPGRSPSSSTASPKSMPPSQRKNILSYLLPFLSFLCFINHILNMLCNIFHCRIICPQGTCGF